MNITIEKMLSHVYEIEGLMLVTRRLGEENTPDVITNKIQRKVRELAEMCGVELTVKPEEPAPAAPKPEPVPEPTPEPASEPTGLPEDDYNADETWQHDNGEEFKEVFTIDENQPQYDGDPHQVPVADREPDDDITVEFIEAPDEAFEPVVAEPEPEPEPVKAVQPPVFRGPVDTSDEPVPEPDPEVLPEDDRDLPDISVEFIEAEGDAVPEPEPEMPMPPVPTDFPVADTAPVAPAPASAPAPAAAPLRVDEKLQRHLSRDIRKAFSVNDRFRFQRELFAGSASAMNTAIEHIEIMNSYGNAELYFFSQLHWDRDNETVKDFMAIVQNHFQR